jgi:hypothetical protein
VEGVQVSEYERRINEVLLAAFRLQRRGRHSGRVHRTKQLNLVG